MASNMLRTCATRAIVSHSYYIIIHSKKTFCQAFQHTNDIQTSFGVISCK